VLTKPAAFDGSSHLLRTLSNVGEQLTFGLDPSALAGYLAECGIRLEKNLSAPEYRRRYYGVEAERMRGHEFYQVAFGTVSGGL
jgi:hypothetical protein